MHRPAAHHGPAAALRFHAVPAPADLRPWVSLAVEVAFDDAGEGVQPCHFPALVEGGLTVVLEGSLFAPGPGGVLLALPTVFLSGAQAAPLTLYRTPRLRCAGLRLQPAGTLGLLQESPLGLAQGIADAWDVFGPAAGGLRERLQALTGAAARAGLLLAFARERLGRELHVQRLQRARTLQQAALRTVDPAAATGLGVRQFERAFSATFGLPPKLFQRIARLEHLLRDALVDPTQAGAELALRHGYYDQSHMARDLRLLAGAPLRSLAASVRQQGSAHWALAIGTAPPARPPVSHFS